MQLGNIPSELPTEDKLKRRFFFFFKQRKAETTLGLEQWSSEGMAGLSGAAAQECGGISLLHGAGSGEIPPRGVRPGPPPELPIPEYQSWE